MRGERSGVCVFDGEDSTHYKARDPEGCSGPRVLINTNKCENFKGLYPLVEHGEKNVLLATAAFCKGLSDGCSQSGDEAITEEAQLRDGRKKAYFL